MCPPLIQGRAPKSPQLIAVCGLGRVSKEASKSFSYYWPRNDKSEERIKEYVSCSITPARVVEIAYEAY